MKICLENMDLDINELNNIVEVYETSKDNKRLKDYIDRLELFNITFVAEDINMMMYTMLLSMNNIDVIDIPRETINFENLDFGVDYITEDYRLLIDKYYDIRQKLFYEFEKLYGEYDEEDEKFNMLLEYLEPNSKLIDVKLSMSIKQFIRFVVTCSKYDELIEILVNFDDKLNEVLEIVNTIIEIAEGINISSKEIFMRNLISKENRVKLIEDNIGCVILSNEEYIKQNIKNGNSNVKASILSYGSNVAFRHIIKNFKHFNIKIENPKHLNSRMITSIFANEYELINDDLLNEIDKYIYDWTVLINYINLENEIYDEIVSKCYLGCFINIFKMNNLVNDYFILGVNENIGGEVRTMINYIANELNN